MTGIAESSLDQCSKYRPRFNEESCFFSGIYKFKHWSKAFRTLHATVNLFLWLDIESKSVWFFLPIGIALLINTVIFALTCRAVCALDAQARDLGITSGQRSKKMERYVICAKMMLITIPDILLYVILHVSLQVPNILETLFGHGNLVDIWSHQWFSWWPSWRGVMVSIHLQ